MYQSVLTKAFSAPHLSLDLGYPSSTGGCPQSKRTAAKSSPNSTEECGNEFKAASGKGMRQSEQTVGTPQAVKVSVQQKRFLNLRVAKLTYKLLGSKIKVK